jgi:hypothetical protein
MLIVLQFAALEAWAENDDCTVSDDKTTVTCAGDQSRGINLSNLPNLPPSVTNFLIKNLTTRIDPDAGTDGIFYQSLLPSKGFPQPPRNITIKFDAVIGVENFLPDREFDNSGVDASLTGAPGSAGLPGNSILPSKLPSSGGPGVAPGNMTLIGTGSVQSDGSNLGAVFAEIVNGRGGDGGNGGTNRFGAGGGAGGAGGQIDVGNQGDWTIDNTGSLNAHGIYLNSIGGTGGNGGKGGGGTGGGRGGSGGKAPDIVFQSASQGGLSVKTQGANSHGLFLSQQSGNGGNQGTTGSKAGHKNGVGGNGGNGSKISATLGRNFSSTTTGTGSAGLYALSRGGDGGIGRDGAVLDSGGTGGRAGEGGAIDVKSVPGNSASITTSGENASGVFLLSEGGNGGKGGKSPINLPGNGGWGGGGGAIKLEGDWTIVTDKAGSYGIVAQSLGGTGGAAGKGGFFGGGGSQGGSTGLSGPVTINTGGSIQTEGAGAYGILAQSVGGHAGDASTTIGILPFAAAGGSAGGGGDVTITNAAAITTGGEQAIGMVAQSIGGGGGNGGSAFGLFYAKGARGGAGGKGGNVTVENSGDLTTSGNDATAIAAQSIGGTGGTGGNAGSFFGSFGGGGASASNAGAVSVKNTGVIETGKQGLGDSPPPDITNRVCGSGCSEGILAQSIGGGGGKAGTTGGGFFSVGAKGGGGGNGGEVTVDNFNRITTALKSSGAIEAQSVGGSGGKGGGAVSVGILASVAVGGDGGGAGDGGMVTVNNWDQSALMTEGDSSPGIRAQSIGGAGGTGGFAGSLSVGPDLPSISIAVGGKGGKGGRGLPVSVFSFSDITTAGRDSPGIYAESLGGGGGKGGFAASLSGGNLGNFSLGVGGKGDAGGDGDVVMVAVSDGTRISTLGGTPPLFGMMDFANSPGIYAHSKGGSGGNGGFAFSGAVGAESASFGVGGDGNKGGSGSVVTVNMGTGSISTAGGFSPGIDAQSLGGGGGNGGVALSFAGGGGVGALAASYGGAGNAAGSGGLVTVTNKAAIRTVGAESTGIFAQSLGGGGGNGGMAVSSTFLRAPEGPKTFAASVSVGGGGGAAGNGSPVTVDNSGHISVFGNKAKGIQAQSVGGGGGNGGLALSGTWQVGPKSGPQFNVQVSVGGSGSKGGDGAAVNVTNSGNITTDRSTNLTDDPISGIPVIKHSYGIFAQSVGGGGGTGGLVGSLGIEEFAGGGSISRAVNTSFDMGGKGGTSGKGSDVKVTNSGTIQTMATSSSAIFAQSISNGGGVGGSSFNYKIGALKPGIAQEFNFRVAVGGAGGASKAGGKVEVDNTGSLETNGFDSHGIHAQSVGGGGGSGGNVAGSTYSFEREGTEKNSVNINSNWGGTGGKGGDGGNVTVENKANITTTGIQSKAIYAQSIGGGGGNGGGDKPCARTKVGDCVIGEVGKIPVSIPSYKKFSLNVGGSGGVQGHGGNVNVTQDGGLLLTKGLGSAAIFAQSVGGGGGESISGQGGTISGGLSPTITVGGGDKAGGNGGDVTVTLKNGVEIVTSGEPYVNALGELQEDVGSYGIFAQSVGGGGGVGGTANLGSLPFGGLIPGCPFCGKISTGMGLAISRGGGSGGNGGAVTLKVEGGSITTGGANSPAIFAQSVGGGGGVAGFSAWNPQSLVVNVGTFIGSGTDVGSGGIVNIDYTGKIKTTGNASHGIFAQSGGGGKKGPKGQPLSSRGGAITISFDGMLTATGENAYGILAQSGGADGAGNVTVNIAEGSTVSGGKKGKNNNAAGIMIMDGGFTPTGTSTLNTLNNEGTVTSFAGIKGVAVAYTGKSRLLVNNSGMIIGDVSSLVNTDILNQSGGGIQSELIDLSGKGTLTNQKNGVIYPGGDGRVGSTKIAAAFFQQDPGGILVVDIDGAKADRVNVSGPAILGGFVQPNLLNTPEQRSQEFTILGSPSLTNKGITVNDTAVIDYSLSFSPTDSSLTEMVLGYDLDFSASGLNYNQTQIGDHFNEHFDQGGSSSLQPVVEALLDLPDLTSLANAYNQLSPEIYLDTEIAALYSNRDFTDSMMSCPVREGVDAFIREDECVWARVKGRQFDQDTAFETFGFDETAFQVSGGAQFALGEAWRLGAALGYEDSDLWTDTNAEADGDRLNGGVVLKYNPGALLLAAAVSGGWGWYDTERRIDFPGFSAVSSANNEIGVIDGRLRAAYLFSSGAWYAKPMVDLDATYLDLSNTRERGAGGASLIVNGNDETVLSASPALELGTQFQWSNGTLIRPYVRGGATFFDNTDFVLEASFEGSADGAGPFLIRSNTDDVVANLSTGVDLIASGGARLKMFYDGSFGDDVEEHSGGIKVSLPLQPDRKVRAALK